MNVSGKKVMTVTALLATMLVLALLTSCFLPLRPGGNATHVPDVTDVPAGEVNTNAPATGAPASVPPVPTDVPSSAPTDAPTKEPTAGPTEDPAAASAKLALEFAETYAGTWTAKQAAIFMHFFVENGTPYVTLGDWSLVRPTFTGKITGAEKDEFGRLNLNFDFSGTEWTSENGVYRVESDEPVDGDPVLSILNMSIEYGHKFVRRSKHQYPETTQTVNCSITDFLRDTEGYWDNSIDGSSFGYLITRLDKDRVLISLSTWSTGEIINSYTVKKITRNRSAVGDSYDIETVNDFVYSEKNATVSFEAQHSRLLTGINRYSDNNGSPWVYYKGDPDPHKEQFDRFMYLYKGTRINTDDNTYIHVTYMNGKPYFQMGKWGESTPDFAGEIVAAEYSINQETYIFGAKYKYGDILYCEIKPEGFSDNAPVMFKTGYSNTVYSKYVYDASKQLS